MDTRSQTSFIPKRSVAISGTGSHAINLGITISVTLFIIALLLTGGLYAGNLFLAKAIDKNVALIKSNETKYDFQKINVLIAFNNRLELSDKLLSNHIAVSKLFDSLQQIIARKARFDSLSFNLGVKPTDVPSLVIHGQAANYDVVAYESDTLTQSAKFLKKPVISDVNLDQSGFVNYTLTSGVDTKALLYDPK